ncbi:hypothetical protein [Leadbettera azotonutricia]|uniref:Putative lipoprotein n=1 Tax=Leadbettera azotonutricia (strain ATCC BAA-888 / DSM 13862 / ZAS-9) TaxID=545695 RepID=F5YC54_LEAAZ|nr:hypothetical protein [Leadbettera azotonutricia]AEF81871.1 putative lipoprotein [Leadbettera azotonutricia ZAS-9]
MAKKIVLLKALCGAFVMAILSGCIADPVDPEPQLAALDGTVWAGPQGDTGWVTLAFRAAAGGDQKKDAAIQFASETNPGNTAHTEEYTYDETAREGFMPKPIRSSPSVDYEAPGAFALGAGDKTLRFTDFQGSGSPLTLKKLLPDAGNTFALIDPLPGDLENTIWVSEGFRTDDWVTLSFRGANGSMIVQVSHVADSTQYSRVYTYSGNTKTGGIVSVGSFEILENGVKLTMVNYYGHGVPVDFKRVR